MDTPTAPLPSRTPALHRSALGLLTWAIGWTALWLLDGTLDLANLALLLVLCAALAALWLPAWASGALGVAAMLAFNWNFIPPRGTFTVDLHQHALLLGTMLLVSLIVSLLVQSQRRQADVAEHHARRAEQLRAWSETLRDSTEPVTQAGALQELLQQATGGRAHLLLLRDGPVAQNDDSAALIVGHPDADQRIGLWHCLHQSQPMGPGAHRHTEQPDWYLPLRARGVTLGAAVLTDCHRPEREQPELRAHLQALCDQYGLALQRTLTGRDEQRARDQARTQSVRSTLLAAIAHDYRTPLATILGAASSLQEQDDRLDARRRRQLATTIVEETTRLGRLTDNTLQLARLDAPGVQLRCDWESAEELVGACLNRLRRRDPERRARARLEPSMPLLWCDALLVTQLLDNLLDNALKYSPPEAPVEILVRRQGDQAVLAVRDRGPGIPPAWRERVFDVFQRGEAAQAAGSERPGVGVGLAVCRAIARAHGGELKLRPRHHGGSAFECWLPLRTPPALEGTLP